MHYVGRLTIQQVAWELGVAAAGLRDLRRGQGTGQWMLWHKLHAETAPTKQDTSVNDELTAWKTHHRRCLTRTVG